MSNIIACISSPVFVNLWVTLTLESHSVSHQEALFFLFQIVLVDLSGVFFPHSVVQDPPFSLCMMCLKSGWTKMIQD